LRPVCRARIAFLALLTAVSVGSQVACAQGAAGDVNSTLLACAALGTDSERLACYDRLADRLRAGQGRQAAPVGDPAKDMFGLKAPTEPPAAKAVERSALASVSARVTSVRQGLQGGVTLELDNGQTWQQLGSSDLRLDVGDTVKISRAALGSFWLTTPAKLGARVTRIR
jgi:hypothetical protein